MGCVPGVESGSECRRFGGASHRKLVQIGLADQDATGFPEAIGDGGFVGRNKLLEHAAGAGGADTLSAEVVLDRQGDSGE